MAALSAGVLERVRTRLPAGTAEAAHDQAVVASGQVGAGLGNLVFSLVMARLLVPGSFAQLASFLALYTLLSLPGSSISAAASLAPGQAERIRPLLTWGGAAVGTALVVGAPWIGPFMRLPVAMVVVLGLSGPLLGTLALERGRLYGKRGHGQLAASLIAEPAVRLTLGVGLATAVGAVGGALGITVAGYGALEIARRRRRVARHARAASARRPEVVAPEVMTSGASNGVSGSSSERGDGPGAALAGALLGEGSTGRSRVTWTALAFLLLVVVQNQDLLFANRVLSPVEAGQFAVLSTLGGIAAFATLTAPLVLLPRTASGGRGALMPALTVTGLLGGAALAIAAAAPRALVVPLFGSRYGAIAGVVAPYMLAMALLGIARVLAAHCCATSAGRIGTALVAASAATQALLIVNFGHDPREVALSTLAATAGLTLSLGTVTVFQRPAARQWTGSLRLVVTQPLTLALAGISGTAMAVRLVIPRGLWLDEVTSVYEAREPFHAMLNTLRTSDVHPPLYFAVLWVTIRWFGSGEMAVRIPSVVAGTLVIPALYLLAKEAYDRRTGIVAAVVALAAPIMVWYSQEARMYSMLMLFGVLAMWAQVRILKRGSSALVWVVYTLASAGLAWTQYFGLLQVAVQQAMFLVVLWTRRHEGPTTRRLAIAWALSALVLVATLVPLASFAHQQFVVNQTSGKGFGAPQQVGSAASLDGNHLGIYAIIANLIWAVWGYHSTATMALLGALWPLGMLLALVVLGRRRQSITTLLAASVVVPIAAMFAIGLVKRNLFDIRYLSTTVPLLLLLVARGITGLARSRRLVGVATAALLVTMVVGLIDQQYNGSNPRIYDFRGALGRIYAQSRPGDVLLFDPGDLNQVVAYYAPALRAEGVGSTSTPVLATGGHEVFILASPGLMNGSSNAAALDTELKALRSHDHLVQRWNLANVEVWVYR
ncbi:MAG: hypothetical protein JWO62_3626 [Acidimicrobiaceae bacterium]|nr:hypothetical protein [Acidimicrobiaceae bacterium]